MRPLGQSVSAPGKRSVLRIVHSAGRPIIFRFYRYAWSLIRCAMGRSFLFFGPIFFFLLPTSLLAHEDDGPPISITSPDTGNTYAFGSIKHRALIWDKKTKTLIVQVTFIDSQQGDGQSNEDEHEFKLPGISSMPRRTCKVLLFPFPTIGRMAWPRLCATPTPYPLITSSPLPM